jgi:hypothetical protein
MTWLILPVVATSWSYMLTSETGMPHLEDNLRYAITHETRCLTREELFAVFPVLKHPSLNGCSLHPAEKTQDTITYDLSCQPDHGTTGQARWQVGPKDLQGTLRIRLGGKNMTFYQRITATPIAECHA